MNTRKFICLLLSIIFHPLLILTYGVILLRWGNPFLFGLKYPLERIEFVVLSVIYTFLLPLISVLILRGTGLVQSVFLNDKKERLGPLMITIVFYTWYHLNIRNQSDMPEILLSFTLGSIIALGFSFFITIFNKLSLHMVGMGGLLGILMVAYWNYGFDIIHFGSFGIHLRLLIFALLLLSGLIASCRLYLNEHIPKEIYGGLLVGLCSQFLAMRYL